MKNQKIKSWFSFRNISVTIFLLILTLIFTQTDSITFWHYDGLIVDNGVFLEVAEEMKNGAVPYRDTFDHKGPLLYFINFLGLSINDPYGIYIFTFLAVFLTCIFIYKINRKILSPTLSCLSTLLIMSIYPVFGSSDKGDMVEQFAMPLIAISLYIFISFFQESKTSWQKLIICGFCLGGVLLLRPNMIALWVIFIPAVIIHELKQKNYQQLLKESGLFLIGLAIALLPFLIYFAANDALDDLWNTYILFNIKYSQTKNLSRTTSILTFALTPIFIVSIITLLIETFRKKTNRPLDISYIAYLLLSVFLMGFGGRNYSHYGMLLIPAAAYPFSIILSNIEREEKQTKYLSIGLVIFLSFYYVPGTLIAQTKSLLSEFATVAGSHKPVDNRNRVELAVANFVQTNTNEEDRIIVFGNIDRLYIYSHRLSASTYSYQNPIINIEDSIKQKFWQELEENPPAAIVSANSELSTDKQKYIEKHGYVLSYENSGFSVYLPE